jgi:filamentous hemagglutinin family protein
MKTDVKQRARSGASQRSRSGDPHASPGRQGRPSRRLRDDPLLRRTCISAMLAACFDMAAANPTGPQVVNGQVSFKTSGNVLAITNSPNAIINWADFSINPGELTRFIQQNPNSSVLNRIVGQNPSQILGALQSNGKVFLINPNGVLFGAGARVDTQALVASSLNLSNADFLAGKLNFSGAAMSGNVSNKGAITTPGGGQVYLLAPNVENSGVITSPNGEVILAAGQSVRLVDSANPDLHVVVSAPANSAINLGQIVAQAGQVGIYGALVKQRGVVNADSAVIGANGKVVLKASRDTLLEAGSVTSANGAGKGGRVELLGNRVGLLGDAQVSADGGQGGGTVLVGGDWQGRNTQLPNAQFAWVSPQASIRANALQQGDGGKVVVWADQGTQFYGSIAARGGIDGGNGGQVETSGKRTLDLATGRVEAGARGAGQNGQWLLDPSDVTIVHGAAGGLSGGVFDPGTVSSIGDTQINTALAGGTDVTIQTSGGTGGTGAIVVNGSSDANGAVNIVNRGGGTRSLTLDTSGAINLHYGASIAGQVSNPLNLSLRGVGGITVAGSIDNVGGNTTLVGATTLSGSIKNSTLTSSNTVTGSSGALDNVTIGGTLMLAGGMFVDTGLTLDNGATLNLGNSSLYFRSSGTAHFATSGSGTVNLAGAVLYAGYATQEQTLQIDKGVTLAGYGTLTDSNAANVINDGTIVANTPGQTLSLTPHSISNSGTLKANSGTLTVGHVNWTNNSGSMAVASNGTLNLQFDTTTAGLGTVTRSGGTVNYSGVLENSNSTLDIGSSGPFGAGGLSQFSGTLSGGTLKSGDSTVLNSASGTLDGVSVGATLGVSGGLFVANGLSLENGANLNLGNSSLYFKSSGTQHIAAAGNATINSAGATLYAGYGINGQTLQLDSGVTLQGYGGLYDSSPANVINAGVINAATPGQTLTIRPTGFTNGGSLQASSGTLSIGQVGWSNSGSMSVGTGGILNLGFDTTTAGLGSITRSGGSVNLNGVLDNSAATLDIGGGGIFGAGGLTHLGGSIKNGTLKSGDSTVLASNSGTLDGVSVSGTLGTSGGLFVKNDLTLADGAVLNLGNSSLYFQGNGTRHIATAGTATLNSAGATVYAGYGATGQTLQLDGGVTLQGYGGLYDSTPANVINAGVINAATHGQTFTIQTTSFANVGSLQASSGTLNINHIGWSNSGGISVGAGGTLNLGFDTTTAALGSITRSGGSVNYNGVLDNSAATLDIGGGGIFGNGGLTHLGGSIKNGTLKSGDSSVLSSNGKLDGVTVSGTLGVSGSVEILNGLTLANGAVLNLGNSSMYIEGSGVQHIATAGSASVNLAGSTIYAGYGSTGQTLQIDSGITMQGYGYLGQSQVATISNAGTLVASDSSQVLNIQPNVFNNSGTLRANGLLQVGQIGWNNSGTLEVNGGATFNAYMDTTVAGLGTIVRGGGSINYHGVLDNSANTLDIGSGGVFGNGGLSMLNGSIKNGNLKSADNTPLHANGATLDNVTVSGNLSLSGSANIKNGITLANGVNFDLGNSSVYFTTPGVAHIASPGNASLRMVGAAVYGGYGINGQTLQIDSGVTLHGYGYLYQSSITPLVNNGAIVADVAGQSLAVSFNSISNNGSMRADTIGSTLSLSGMSANNGVIDVASGATVMVLNNGLVNNAGATIAGSGTLSFGASGSLSNNGTVLPGGAGSVGTLHLTGNYVQGSTGELVMDAGPDTTTHDVLAVSGTATLGGKLTANALGSFAPGNNENYPFVTYSALATGTFATINATAFAGATPDYATNGSFLLKMPNGTVINIWNFDGSGNWNDPSKWSLGHVPTATEDVQVPDYSSQFTINIAANSQLAKSVVFVGNDKLGLSGGSLSVTNGSTLSAGTLDLSGNGIFNAGGNLAVHTLNLADNASINLASGKSLNVFDYTQLGGAINGAANIVISNSYNRSGGSFDSNLTGLEITQASDDLTPGAITIAGRIKLKAEAGNINIDQALATTAVGISLAAPQGAIINAGGSITAPALGIAARSGIGNGNALETQVGLLQVINSGTGDISINNSNSALALSDIGKLGFALRQEVQGGKVTINNSGVHPLSITDPVQSIGGTINLTAPAIWFDNNSLAMVDGGAGSVYLRAEGAGGLVLPSAASIKINGSSFASRSVTLEGDNLALAGAINAGPINGTGYVSIAPVSQVPLVVENARPGGHLSLSPADLARISASGLTLTNYNGSNGVVFADPLALSAVRHLQVFTNDSIAVNNALSVSGVSGSVNLVPTNGSLVLGSNGTLSAKLITVQQAHVIDLANAGAATVGVADATVKLQADHLRLGSNAPLAVGNGTVHILPSTTGLPLDIVSSVNPQSPNLQLAAGELADIAAATLKIGDSSGQHGSGTLSLNAALATHAAVGALVLEAGCDGGSNCAGIVQTASGAISTPALLLKANSVQLSLAGNQVDNLAAETFAGGNGIAFANGKDLNIGAKGLGVLAPGQAVSLQSGANLSLSAALQADGIQLQASGTLGGAGLITGKNLSVQAGNGIGLTTQVQTLSASNSGTATDINVLNQGSLQLNAVTQGGSGNIHIDNHGAMTVSGPVNFGSGMALLETHSPLLIDGSVTSSNGGNINLRAGASSSVSDTLTLTNNAVVTTSGGVLLQAGEAITIGSGATLSPQVDLQAGRNAALPSVSDCLANPLLARCVEALPSQAACIAAPQTPGCSGAFLNVWNFDGNGNWNDPAKWSLGHVPRAAEDVKVPDFATSFTLGIGSPQNVRSVVFVGDDKLALAGGSLTLATASSLAAGTIEIAANGVLNVGGDLAVKDLKLSSLASLNLGNGKTLSVANYDQSGGTLGGSGTLVVGNSYQRSGGTLGNTLAGLDITQANGDLAAGALDVAGPITLTASNGNIHIDQNIHQSAPNITTLTAPHGAINDAGGQINVPILRMTAQNGIGHGSALNIDTGNLQVQNTGSGDIALNNAGSTVLTIDDSQSQGFGIRQQGTGAIAINSGGGNGLVINAQVQGSGDMSLKAASITLNNLAAAEVNGGNGNLTLNASGAGGIVVSPLASLKINGAANTVLHLQADAMDLQGSINGGAATVQLLPHSVGKPIAVVASPNQVANTLNLQATRLQAVKAGTLAIGDESGVSGSGALSVLAALNPQASVLELNSGCNNGNACGTISQAAGGVITVANLVLDSANGVSLHAAVNQVDHLAANSAIGGNGISFANGKSLAIGVAGEGIAASAQTVNLSVSGGNLSIDQSVSGSAITLAASGGNGAGSISGSALVAGNSLAASASNGIHLHTSVAALSAGNSSSGDIVFNNTIPLTINAVGQSGPGAIRIDNTGATTVHGPVTSTSGAIAIKAHSPLTVDGSVISSAGGAITLEAGSSNSSGDILAINSGAVVTSSGPVMLKAGSSINVDPASTVSPQAQRLPGQNTPLPSINDCVANPALARCSEVLPTLASCISNPGAPGCSVILPSLASCTALPATPGCSVVLPSLDNCTATPSIPGCSAVLPSLLACVSAPTTPGCGAVLPSIATCTLTPTKPGCSAVLPTLDSCIASPAASGCSVVLPAMATCVSAPGTPGCRVVLPSIATCTVTPGAPGCSVVLPTLAICISAPATPGCSVVLPSIASCTLNPQAPGCSVVLPPLATCISAPATPGCGAVLPSIAICTANPQAPGCGVVLPPLPACISAPAKPGCSVVLPTILACTTDPALPGCGAVLPNTETCSLNPQAAGCNVVLPKLATCISAPATPGCSAVLPGIASCTLNPQAPGCSVVLPPLASCVSAPATPGCSVVLPGIASCTLNPQGAGCSVVLPPLASCISAPATPGCSAVLPSIASCSLNPQAAGCSVVLPTLAACISAPTAPGCHAVLPTLAACSASPGLPGCAVVLPNIADCLSNPGATGCQVVVTPGDGKSDINELNHALNNTVDIVTSVTTPKPAAQPVLLATVTPQPNPESPAPQTPSTAPGAAGNEKAPDSAAKPGDKPADKPADKPDDAKKDEKKDDVVVAKTEAKKEEPAKKLYCN